MIDAIDNDFLEFKAMIYGGHPGRYWSGLLEEAHFWAIGHFNSLGRLVNFKLTLIKSPHFCAVIHGYDYSQWLKMDLQSQSLLELMNAATFGKLISLGMVLRRILWC
jgi:hypothetical protein